MSAPSPSTSLRRKAGRAGALALLAATLLGAGPVEEAPSPTGFLTVTRYETGYVAVSVAGQARGRSVTFSEVVGKRTGPIVTLPLVDGKAHVYKAVAWRCGRPLRHFSATVTDQDGTQRTAIADIRTPGCDNRVSMIVADRAKRGELVEVALVDRWGLGNRVVDLCAGGAGLTHSCRKVSLAKGDGRVVRRYRPKADGQLRIALKIAGRKVTERVAVGRAKPLPSTAGFGLLTTGDSTIEGIDSVLDDALGSAARVLAESKPGAKLSGGGALDWLKWATEQEQKLTPRVVVISLGANEGYPVERVDTGKEVDCCDAAWIIGMAAAQRRLMQVYRQGSGNASVVWLLQPTPRSPARARVQAAVNTAAYIAAVGLPYVHLLDLGPLFTPGGVYRDNQDLDGEQVRVRAPDGIHLSGVGQRIAGDAVVELLTRKGLLD
ncbi:hypothetical protein DSM112329_03282 [Paraconexibacter sp. AEG42_29]|uniref:SGNH hydrolase-type esterase domain-containing protein n=1 Tax=Paraconexibacter sp. AEG42_29 TaxID=2997339 RepID=A0AAU7AXM5_9ACTN